MLHLPANTRQQFFQKQQFCSKYSVKFTRSPFHSSWIHYSFCGTRRFDIMRLSVLEMSDHGSFSMPLILAWKRHWDPSVPYQFQWSPPQPVNKAASTLGVREIFDNYCTSLAGYKMIDGQQGTQHWVGYNPLISNKCEWNYSFIKNAP